MHDFLVYPTTLTFTVAHELVINRPFGAVAKDVAIGVGGLGFDI